MESIQNNVTENSNDSSINLCDDDSDFPDFYSLTHPKNLRQSTEWSTVIVVAYVMNFLAGMTGNIIVILVTFFKAPMRTVTNMFLLNLAVADLFVNLFCTPANLLANLFIPWILGSFLCKAVAYLQGVSVCASAYSIAALSLDRCHVIYRSMERHPGISKNQAWWAIIFIWIISLLITSPWPFTFQVMKEDCQIYCYEVWNNENLGKIYFLLATLIGCYCIPLICTLSSNIAIWNYISKRHVIQDSVSISQIQRKTRHSVKKTIGVVTSVFLICWLPLYVLATRIKFTPVNGIAEWEGSLLSFLLPCAQWLGSLNSSVNPIIYAFFNRKFRKAFRSFFCSVAGKIGNRVGSLRGSLRKKQAFVQLNQPPLQRSKNENKMAVAVISERQGNDVSTLGTSYI